ncbi:MAG TPA: hypothetical protein VLV89_03460, partial [Candidatus Acidoferrum sp.]|nr:hypothetical protein [Candidatus Acidoferrum sp.]
MWGKKPEQTAPPAALEPKAAMPPKPAPSNLEEHKMSTDAMRPLATPSSSGVARLGASLHVKGEINGHEDLLVDGSVEGLI